MLVLLLICLEFSIIGMYNNVVLYCLRKRSKNNAQVLLYRNFFCMSIYVFLFSSMFFCLKKSPKQLNPASGLLLVSKVFLHDCTIIKEIPVITIENLALLLTWIYLASYNHRLQKLLAFLQLRKPEAKFSLKLLILNIVVQFKNSSYFHVS